ncbi:uncharacterized protein LOC110462394 [Mizuhopecten yessoensis]|uniref:uncharacterized protein LOC110462394 n=1 Tax=Mizuhopecten yessoensis TaxID=6573 RepID=UPI000B457C3E|nr:uncharacterized protein LOC110462394 [Mizuhopecten yessoensis]
MENQKFAIVQWIDRFTSIINLDAVKFPRKPLEDYTEGEYVTALYGKKKYEARISEISGDRTHLASKKSNEGNYPLSFVYEDHDEPRSQSESHVKRTASADQVPASDTEKQSTLDTVGPSNSGDHVPASDTEKQSSLDAGGPSTGGQIPESDAAKQTEKQASRDTIGPSSCDTSVPELPNLFPRTPTATPVSSYSSKRKLERKVDQLEKDVKELRGTVKSLNKRLKAFEEKEADTTPSKMLGSGACSDSMNSDSGFEELMSAVSHLPGIIEKDINAVVRRTSLKVFSAAEILGCTRTGKKTVKCGETAKQLLATRS